MRAVRMWAGMSSGPSSAWRLGAQIAPAADRSHPLLGHQGLQVGGQIDQHPRIGVLIDGERAGGVQTGQVGQAIGQPAGPKFRSRAVVMSVKPSPRVWRLSWCRFWRSINAAAGCSR